MQRFEQARPVAGNRRATGDTLPPACRRSGDPRESQRALNRQRADRFGILRFMLLIESLGRSVAAGACALTLLATPAVAAAPDAPAPVAVGRLLPDVMMAGLNGPHRSLSSYRGHPLIINVWASWCGPCRAEAASLERMAWGEAGSRYVVIGISTDDDRDAALKWLRHSNATVSHYIDSRLTLEHMLGASSIPLTVLVDAGGRVVARFQGARQWDSVESIRMIERAFAGAAGPTPTR
jgi:thiol-disulfide isomerase/thioredoxin